MFSSDLALLVLFIDMLYMDKNILIAILIPLNFLRGCSTINIFMIATLFLSLLYCIKDSVAVNIITAHRQSVLGAVALIASSCLVSTKEASYAYIYNEEEN